ncbi:hypothetical protein HDA40_000065 [Hamadaea flava]|uniref:Uncharacterized protein n=1 Tax=Hamadaea flava TaxID=1742688 RepID=A0ABV8LM41_9ACTN|nr:hypothetical protein [Hamadaea flava]MCP2321558.1 hypothetical protein [Hamadaea flava]
MRAAPRSITRLAVLLPSAGVIGAVEVAYGLLQVFRLNANEAAAYAAAPAAAEAVARAVSNLEASAQFCLWTGLAATLLLAGGLLVRKAVPYTRVILWLLWGEALLGNLLLFGDTSVGLKAFVDPDPATEALVNQLLLAPGRSLVLYTAEVMMIGLLGWIAMLLRNEETVEFLKIRTESVTDPAWEALMAARRNRENVG